MLRMGNRGPAVDTRVGVQRGIPSSSHRISGSSTNSERSDVVDTDKYKNRHICHFCSRKFSRANVLAKHIKYNCLQNSEAQCNTSDAKHPFVGKDCGRRFQVRKHLTYHIKHECQKYNICPMCNTKLVGARVSKKHMALCKGKKKMEKLTDVVLPVKEKDLHPQLIVSSDENSD